MSESGVIKFGIVGSGWRSGCYLNTAALLGERCIVAGITGRNPTTRNSLASHWKVPVYQDERELTLRAKPDFLFVAVKGEASASVLLGLIDLDIPLLVETPPASTIEGLEALYAEAKKRKARIQVAEQYWLQPLQQARLAAIEAGLIGKPSYAHVSVNHGYHNISLMRKYLGVGYEKAALRAASFTARITGGPGRGGPPQSETILMPEHLVGLLDFGEKGRGLFDFESDQHRSWIRTERLVVRGEKGELADSKISYLEDFRSPVHGELRRVQTGGDGDFEDYYLKGIMLGSRWLYRNPFAPARLSDEEISQAACLAAMEDYVRTGTPFYSLAEAAQDQYLSMQLRQAAESGETLVTDAQAWAY
jgi:predicted dehydrogenase